MRTFANEEEALAFLGTIPWGIAAGVTRNHVEALNYAGTGMTAVGYGSIIEESGWGGNSGDVYYYDERTGASINNIGLGDPGINAHMDTLPETMLAVERRGAKLWVSFSGRLETKPSSYHAAALRLTTSKASHVHEANTACGNVLLPDGTRKKTLCLDLPLFKEVVAAHAEGSRGVETAVKVGPSTDVDLIGMWVATCITYGIDYLEFANTIPNGSLMTPEFRPAVTGNRGGIGGTPLEPYVMAMLREAVPLVKNTGLKLIATGAILNGEAAYRRLLAGAHGFRFNTLCTRPGGGPKSVAELIAGTEREYGLLHYLVKYGLPTGAYA